jgi:hypothetical protein
MTKNPTHLTLWLTEIDKLRERGVVICPLMGPDYPAEICACDIPETRAHFFAEQPDELLCCVGKSCLPTLIHTDLAGEERSPKPPPRLKRPRGSWIAALRK